MAIAPGHALGRQHDRRAVQRRLRSTQPRARAPGDRRLLIPDARLGRDQRQTVKLTLYGTWTLYCSLLNHKDLGMQATLMVN